MARRAPPRNPTQFYSHWAAATSDKERMFLAHEEIGHQVDFRLPVDSFARLEKLALQHGLVHTADHRPCVAELIRVLLISELLEGDTVIARAATALYCNSVLVLSGQLNVAVVALRESLAEVVGDVAVIEPDTHTKKKAPRKCVGVVSVILDDALRYRLTKRLAESPPPVDTRSNAPPLSVALTRHLLEHALTYQSYHLPVVTAYARAVGHLRKAITDAVSAGRAEIAAGVLAEREDTTTALLGPKKAKG